MNEFEITNISKYMRRGMLGMRSGIIDRLIDFYEISLMQSELPRG